MNYNKEFDLINKKSLIFINQEDKTEDVKSIELGEHNKTKVEFKNNTKVYSYRADRVEEYKFLEELPVKNFRYSRLGKFFYNDIVAVLKYVHLDKVKIQIYFKNQTNVVLDQDDLKIEKSALFEEKSRGVFEYLRQLADINNLKGEDGISLLSKNYNKIAFVSQESVLYRFLSPTSSNTESESYGEPLIFPFGCNNSQFRATQEALKNQISFIQGPPGTGKTQTILNILSNIVYRGQTALVVSNNNSAIANVQEKLSQEDIALDFLTANLGKQENKNLFFENQSSQYPNYLTNIYENDEKKLDFEKAKKAFNLKEKIANLESQISFVDTEYKHFQDYISEQNILEVDLTKLSPKVVLDLLVECERFFEENRGISFIFKLKSIFKYKIRNFDFYKQDPVALSATIQKKFYEAELEKFKDELSKLEKEYERISGDNCVVYLRECSQAILKHYLFQKYVPGSSREKFNADDINQHNSTKRFLKDYPIILSTTFSANTCLPSSILYDYLIIDEASQVDIVTGALALSCAKNVVIVGDTKQLPNIVTRDMEKKSEDLRKNLKIKPVYSFKKSFLDIMLELFPKVPVTLLKEHYRCHPKIIQFCNQKFYNGDLCVMTQDKGEPDVLAAFKSVEGNHARQHTNQREIDIIKQEVIDCYQLEKSDTGIIAPYRNQVNLMEDQISGFISKTVHKFQGRECDNLIISTVDNQITRFTDNPNLLNVAVSRAKERLILVTSGNQQKKNMNLTDLIDYISYQNCDVKDSTIRSVFDYLYKQYEERRKKYFKNKWRHSKYDSENLMFELLTSVLSSFSNLEFHTQYRLKHLIKDSSLMSENELKFANQGRTSLDFLIFNKITKVPVLAIEVDGYKFHNNSKQNRRDLLKNSILQKYQIPLLRLETNGSNEEKKIKEALSKYQLTNDILQLEDLVNRV